MLITGQKLSFQRLNNILILGSCIGKNRIVVYIHIRLCNIPGYDQSLQLVVTHNRKCNNTENLHHLPCFLHRDMTADTFCLTHTDIAKLRSYIRDKLRRINFKTLQHICSLRINAARTLRHILNRLIRILNLTKRVLIICISDRCTNRIRIRMLMPYDPYFLLVHTLYSLTSIKSLLYTSSQANAFPI